MPAFGILQQQINLHLRGRPRPPGQAFVQTLSLLPDVLLGYCLALAIVRKVLALIAVDHPVAQLQHDVMLGLLAVVVDVGPLASKVDTVQARIQLRPGTTTLVAQAGQSLSSPGFLVDAGTEIRVHHTERLQPVLLDERREMGTAVIGHFLGFGS